MGTLLVFIVLLGFFLLYNTSKKAQLNKSFFLEKIAQDNRGTAKITGLLLLVAALVGSILYWGMAAGIFAFLVILMTVGSAVVLFAPLRYFGHKTMIVVFALSFFMELML